MLQLFPTHSRIAAKMGILDAALIMAIVTAANMSSDRQYSFHFLVFYARILVDIF